VWIDLLDPDEDEVRKAADVDLHDTVIDRLAKPSEPGDLPRPRLSAQGDYVFGILLIPRVYEDDSLVSQELDVIVTPDRLVTVRKTPDGGEPLDLGNLSGVLCAESTTSAMGLFLIMDEIAEQFLDLIDDFDDDINDLEDNVESWASTRIRDKISTIRHEILRVRRSLAPTRDAARSVLDDRVELDHVELFPRDIELRFADAYDKLLRATDGLDLSRDLLAGVRDYHQAQVAHDQNEVMKRLTVIASMLLVPTFIVGLYGQNLKGSPEFGWADGYEFSWAVIILTTIGQFIYFKRKRWI